MKALEEDRQQYSQDVVWQALRVLLPPGPELERRARTTGAFLRKRGVREAANLLRVALSYGFCGLSFDAASTWAAGNRSATLCKSAIIRRIRKCGRWLEGLLADRLASRLPSVELRGLLVRLVDATRVSPPGSKGASWRVHACFDPLSGQLCQLEITDHLGGEHLRRFEVRSGELFVGDRAYGTRPGIWHIASNGGQFLVRTTWQHAPLEHRDGEAFDLFAHLRTISDDEVGDFEVQVGADPRHGIDAVPCRLVAVLKSAEAADAAKKRILAEAKKKRRQVDPRSLEACEYFFVLTSLSSSDFPAPMVLSLYALRWQIEVEFKRLKSILKLDELRAMTSETIRAALAAKLLGAVLVEDLVSKAKGKVNEWTWTQTLFLSACQGILGSQAAAQFLIDPQAYQLAPAPDLRKRQSQCQKMQLASLKANRQGS